MEILYLLIPLTLVFVAMGLAIFFWAVKSGQYEDLEGPAHRILFDDEPVKMTREDRAGKEGGKGGTRGAAVRGAPESSPGMTGRSADAQKRPPEGGP